MTKLLEIDEDEIIKWGGDDPFTHTLVVGPTRCGKTATILKPLIYQILKAKRNGQQVGLSVIEPKGDVARMVKEMAEDMGLKDELTYIDPLYPKETNVINVMKGEKNDVAEATVTVLKSLFGKQDAFFAVVQELSSRKVTLLLKELYGDDMTIMDVLANLRDVDTLRNNVEQLRLRNGTDDLISFFDNELLGTGNMAEKYRQFIVGLRAQLENITANEHLRAIVAGKSDIDLDRHFETGGILAVNSALGLLGSSGDAFGMFIAMHLQLATFRRKGTERTRVPHFIIIDEYSRYINPDVERFLSIAAEYRVALIAAIQSFGQLELESGKLSARAMKKAIMTSTRNKIVFGGFEHEDAKEASLMMGSNIVNERVRTFDGGILQNILPKMYKDEDVEKERFHSTFFMDGLPKFHYVHKLLMDGTPQEPSVAVGDFVPSDWKERLEAEEIERKNNCISIRKRPPSWKVIERMKHDVEFFEFEMARKIKDERRRQLEVNPFEVEDDDDDLDAKAERFKRTFIKERESSPPVTEDVSLKVENPEPVVAKTSYSDIVFSLNSKDRRSKNTEIQSPTASNDIESEEENGSPSEIADVSKESIVEEQTTVEKEMTPNKKSGPVNQNRNSNQDIHFGLNRDLYFENTSKVNGGADDGEFEVDSIGTSVQDNSYLTKDENTFW